MYKPRWAREAGLPVTEWPAGPGLSLQVTVPTTWPGYTDRTRHPPGRGGGRPSGTEATSAT